MTTVGIRDLKAHLSRHLKRVEAGAELQVTSHGRAIATIRPAHAPASLAWAHRLVAEGRASWQGGKPVGAAVTPRLRSRVKSAAEVVLENRR
jgi:prevent-host-death family protein